MGLNPEYLTEEYSVSLPDKISAWNAHVLYCLDL
jgi:hypothetical protein